MFSYILRLSAFPGQIILIFAVILSLFARAENSKTEIRHNRRSGAQKRFRFEPEFLRVKSLKLQR